MKQINVAMVAHDNKKTEMIEWVKTHKESIKDFNLFGTGTTGRLIEEALGQKVHRFLSGPLGGDQQIGAAISEGKINMLIFFWFGGYLFKAFRTWNPIEDQSPYIEVRKLSPNRIQNHSPNSNNIEFCKIEKISFHHFVKLF